MDPASAIRLSTTMVEAPPEKMQLNPQFFTGTSVGRAVKESGFQGHTYRDLSLFLNGCNPALQEILVSLFALQTFSTRFQGSPYMDLAYFINTSAPDLRAKLIGDMARQSYPYTLEEELEDDLSPTEAAWDADLQEEMVELEKQTSPQR